MALIHQEDSEGFTEKSAGKVALISSEGAMVVVLVDILIEFAGGLIAGGTMVAGFIGTGTWIGVLGVVREVVAASRGFAGLGSGTMSLGS